MVVDAESQRHWALAAVKCSDENVTDSHSQVSRVLQVGYKSRLWPRTTKVQMIIFTSFRKAGIPRVIYAVASESVEVH